MIISAKNSSHLKSLRDDVNEIKQAPNPQNPAGHNQASACAASLNMDDNLKTDCHPDVDTRSKESCESRGCCWSAKEPTEVHLNLSTPQCFFPKDYVGYGVDEIIEGPTRIVIKLSRSPYPSGFRKDIKKVQVEINHLDEKKLRIRITDPNEARFEPSLPTLNVVQNRYKFTPQYKTEVNKDGLLKITRISSGKIIFNTDLRQLIFSDQFIQLTSNNLPSKFLYGLGEHFSDFRKDIEWTFYSMKNGDRPPVRDKPLYGTHPFYLMIEDEETFKTSDAHGVLLFNNNLQDVVLQPTPGVNYRTTGGILDFFIYLGKDPQDVISQHLDVVGRFDLPPFWSLGFQLCKWGYLNLQHVKDVVNRTVSAGIPFDVQWVDIDYMEDFKLFTINKVNFTGLEDFVKDLHENKMKFVPIFEPAIEGSSGDYYSTVENGLKRDIFIRNDSDQLFVGKVWNKNSSYFVDFTNPQAAYWWSNEFKRYHDQLDFDGAWLDMNEPANFMNGPKEGSCPKNNWEDLQYVPGNGEPAVRKSICLSNKQFLGRHYDIHNMYGMYEAKATKE